MDSAVPTVNQNIGVSLSGKALTNIASVPGGKYCILSGYGLFSTRTHQQAPWCLSSRFRGAVGDKAETQVGFFSQLWSGLSRCECKIRGCGFSQYICLSYLTSPQSQAQISWWEQKESKWTQQKFFTAHRRPILDLSWSPLEPNILCSASSDNFLKIWDMKRDTANSARKMTYTGGTPHIAKWNRHAPFFILSAHPHGQVCLWDLRVSSNIVICSLSRNRPPQYPLFLFQHLIFRVLIGATSIIPNLLPQTTQQKSRYRWCQIMFTVQLWSVNNPKDPLATIFVGHCVSSAEYTVSPEVWDLIHSFSHSEMPFGFPVKMTQNSNCTLCVKRLPILHLFTLSLRVLIGS